MRIQLTLFKALLSVKIANDDASQVADALEGHIAMKIAEATAPMVSELRVLNGKIDTVNSSLRWMFGSSIALSLLAATIGGYIAFLLK